MWPNRQLRLFWRNLVRDGGRLGCPLSSGAAAILRWVLIQFEDRRDIAGAFPIISTALRFAEYRNFRKNATAGERLIHQCISCRPAAWPKGAAPLAAAG
jgi:hypothetical protein